MTPQLFDKAGLVYARKPLTALNFEMTFDVEISNQKQSQLAHGAMQIYFLRDNPQREPKEFARAFNLLGFSGLLIEVKENHSRIPVGVIIHS